VSAPQPITWGSALQRCDRIAPSPVQRRRSIKQSLARLPPPNRTRRPPRCWLPFRPCPPSIDCSRPKLLQLEALRELLVTVAALKNPNLNSSLSPSPSVLNRGCLVPPVRPPPSGLTTARGLMGRSDVLADQAVEKEVARSGQCAT
jgi:hypothetical protein